MSDGDDDQPPPTGRQRQLSRSRERSYPHAQVPQGPQVQPVIIREPVTEPDEDPTVVNPSSSTGLSPSVEQRDRSTRQQRSRSRERTQPHTSSQSGQQLQQVVPPPAEPQIQPRQDTDEESETVEPQNRTSSRSTLLQSKENPQNQKERKQRRKWRNRMIDLLPKKHKSMVSDEDDKRTLKLTRNLFYLSTFSASANSDDENSEYSDEYSARSQDSGRTVLYPDLKKNPYY